MSKKDVFICSAVRTPVGEFQGSLATVPVTKLGALTIGEAVKRAGVKLDAVEECYMGCILTGALGQNPARQAWIGAEGPVKVPCTTIGKVCVSGLQSVIIATRGMMLDEADVIVAGGM